jgi:hypothetical protein
MRSKFVKVLSFGVVIDTSQAPVTCRLGSKLAKIARQQFRWWLPNHGATIVVTPRHTGSEAVVAPSTAYRCVTPVHLKISVRLLPLQIQSGRY